MKNLFMIGIIIAVVLFNNYNKKKKDGDDSFIKRYHF